VSTNAILAGLPLHKKFQMRTLHQMWTTCSQLPCGHMVQCLGRYEGFRVCPMHAREVVCGQHIAAVWGFNAFRDAAAFRPSGHFGIYRTHCLCSSHYSLSAFQTCPKTLRPLLRLSDRTKARVLCTRSTCSLVPHPCNSASLHLVGNSKRLNVA